ncbi:MAG: hypothetical protein JW729_04520, partial [Bacteroidales bacterium]|nr:hypothetical protein [Bacteroidales bacterium]
MLRLIKSLLKQYLFWLILFAFMRFIFMLTYAGPISRTGAGVGEILSTFFYALKLDVATASYFLIIPFFFLFIQSLISPPWFNILNKIFTGLMVFVFVLINAIELGLYQEWQSKLTYKAFSYLDHPDEIIQS